MNIPKRVRVFHTAYGNSPLDYLIPKDLKVGQFKIKIATESPLAKYFKNKNDTMIKCIYNGVVLNDWNNLYDLISVEITDKIHLMDKLTDSDSLENLMNKSIQSMPIPVSQSITTTENKEIEMSVSSSSPGTFKFSVPLTGMTINHYEILVKKLDQIQMSIDILMSSLKL